MAGIHFEWDEAKNLSNQRKHGISFEVAVRAFFDPLAVSVKERIKDGEQRWQTFGLVDGFLLLLVAHTVREVNEAGSQTESMRIISARPATRKEKQRYEAENRSFHT